MNTPPLLGELNPEQFRQKLAGLIDPDDQPEQTRQTIRAVAIDFVGILPMIFGDDLDRKTLWDRIGSGLQIAFAKTASADVELFISEICRHIHAESAVARSDEMASILTQVTSMSDGDKQSWMSYLNSHMPVVLVHARARWETRKQMMKKGGAK